MKRKWPARLPWLQLSLALHLGIAALLYVTAPLSLMRVEEEDFVYSVSLLNWELPGESGDDELDAEMDEAVPPAAHIEDGDDEASVSRDETAPAGWAPKGGHFNDAPEESVHTHQWVRVRTGALCPQCQAPLSWWDDCSGRDCLQGRGGGHRCDTGSRTELPQTRVHRPHRRPALGRWQAIQKMREREARKRRRGR